MAAITPVMLITMFKFFRHAEEQEVELPALEVAEEEADV